MVFCASVVVSREDVGEDVEHARMCLVQLGYLLPSRTSLNIDENAFKYALKLFQMKEGIKVTGEVDQETKNTMVGSRCSVENHQKGSSRSRRRRYALLGSRWSTNHLTYKIKQYPSQVDLDKDTTDEILRAAFDMWARVIPVTFTQKYDDDPVHIDVSFLVEKYGYHNCNQSSEHTVEVYAHTSSPNHCTNGEIHFNDSILWTVNSDTENDTKVSLLQVATHEIGHVLGLNHSRIKEAVMYCKHEHRNLFDLHDDDIRGIQKLYGSNKSVLCDDSHIDAIFNNSTEDTTYVFKGAYYWKIGNKSIVGPHLISASWKGLPSDIDAAFISSTNTYFFKGTKYWKYKWGQLASEDYPRSISHHFKGIPDYLDTAMINKNTIYFFKGSKYWKYTTSKQLRQKVIEEKTISSTWIDAPENLNAALHEENGYINFFKGAYYCLVLPSKTKVSRCGNGEYRIPVGPVWFNCPP